MIVFIFCIFVSTTTFLSTLVPLDKRLSLTGPFPPTLTPAPTASYALGILVLRCERTGELEGTIDASEDGCGSRRASEEVQVRGREAGIAVGSSASLQIDSGMMVEFEEEGEAEERRKIRSLEEVVKGGEEE